MTKRYFAIKDHKIVSDVDVCPFSIERMDKAIREWGYDGWFELDVDGAVQLLRIEGPVPQRTSVHWGKPKPNWSCETCGKDFVSLANLNKHFLSKGHRRM